MALPFAGAVPTPSPQMQGQQSPPLAFQFLPPNFNFGDVEQPVQQQQRQTSPRKKPQLDDIQRWISEAVSWWQLRDSRMDDDYSRWKLTPPSGGSGEAVVRNTPRIVVDKLANIIGAQVPTTSSQPPQPALVDIAQKKDALIRYAWDEWDRAWSNGLGASSLRQAMVYSLGLRGWLTMRVTLKDSLDTDEFPVDLTFFDPRNIYPRYGHGKLRYVVQSYKSTVGEVLDEWGKDAEKFFTGRPEGDEVVVTGYYDDWWHAVLVDDNPVKPPEAHQYGVVPWVIRIAGGAPIRAAGATGGDTWIGDVGPSFFDSIKDVGAQLDKILSQVATSVAKAADPPAFYYYDPDSPTPKKLDLGSGAQNYLIYDKERVQIIDTSPPVPELSLLINILQNDIQKGTLPEVLWGGGTDVSGFAISLLTGAARDATYGVIRSMEHGEEEINRIALTLLRDLYTQPIGVIVKDPNGNWVTGETITPSEIGQVGTKTIVKYRDVAPKDQMQMAQTAVILTDKHLMARDRAMQDLLGIDNPEKELKKIVSDMTYQDPDIVKNILNPVSLRETSPDYLFQIWLAWQQYQHTMQASGQSSTGGPPQGAPPQPGGMPPAPGQAPPGPPAPMNPAVLFNALQQAQGSAAGGAGLQRQPGVGGVGGQIPGGLGVQ